MDTTLFECNDPIANPIEKISVVADHQNGAIEGGKRLLKHSETAEVEVVCGFVEDQHIATTAEHLRQHEPSSLAAGEFVHPIVHPDIVEQIAPQVGSHGDFAVPKWNGPAIATDFLNDCIGALQLHSTLIDVIKNNALPDGRRSFGRDLLCKADSKQSRFPRSVATNDSRAFARTK